MIMLEAHFSGLALCSQLEDLFVESTTCPQSCIEFPSLTPSHLTELSLDDLIDAFVGFGIDGTLALR